MEPQNQKHGKPPVNFARQTMREYWKHLRQYKFSLFVVLILVPSAALCLATFVPYYLSQAIGQLASGSSDVSKPLLMAGLIGFFGVICNFIGFRRLNFLDTKMQVALIEYLTESILAKDYAFFSNEKIGALTARFIDFVRAYDTLQGLFIIRTLGFVVSMGAGLILVAVASAPLALILLTLITILLVQVRVSLNIRQPYRTERKYIRSSILGEVADAFTNNLVVKTFAREKNELLSVRKKTKRFETVYMKDLNLLITDGTLRQFITTLIQILAIIFAVVQLKNGRMDIATAVFALAYLQRIAAQIFSLGEMINGYDNAFLEAAPMTEMLMKTNKINDSPAAKKLLVDTGVISFNKISYNYEEGDTAITALDYSVAGGKRIGIVGHSGAGKTTITRLMLRFDDVTSGSIEIDGQNISNVTQESLRKAIAYVPQEPLLFHRSLAENIRYGNPLATDEEVEQAAVQAHAHEFIKDLPNGYKTLVGERGVKLSGGQRQRVAIARAVIKNAPILILDEATSALDSESERLIQDALTKLMAGRTTLVIAHRLSTIQKMDRIIVLEKGAIAEEGSHDMLIQQKGIYAKLWAHQSGGFLED